AAVLGNQHQILDAHAQLPRQVDARLHGEHHPRLGNGGAGGAVVRRLVAVQAAAVAQPVGETGAVARVLNHLPGGPVDVPHGDAGADHGLRRQVGGLDSLIDPPALVADRAEEHGAGHVAPVAADGDEDVQHHAVPVFEHRVVGPVVRIGAVGAEAHQLPLAGAVGAVLPVEALYIGGQLTLHRALFHGGDDLLHHLVVDPGGVAHGGDLVGVLVLP